MKQHYPFTVMPLPYALEALEPHIDMETMYFHHDQHLKAYVEKLNGILAPYCQFHGWSLEELITKNHQLPSWIQTGVLENAGGVFNHERYFLSMTPACTQPSEDFLGVLELNFGSFENFYEIFSEEAGKLFGSGYVWLVSDENGKLAIVSYANQDTPIAHGLIPLLPIDVWEHAYYLKHQNRRPAYIRDWFAVVDWSRVEEWYGSACPCKK